MSSCLVFSVGDADHSSVNRTVVRKARKQHRCEECGESICAGERYEENTQIFDGGWSVSRTCIPCQRIRADLACDGFIYGELREAIWQEYGFDYVTGETREERKESRLTELRAQKASAGAS